MLALLLAPVALPPAPAAAHANLVQSDPPAQSVLARSPEAVRLSFSEALVPQSIRVTVVDAARAEVSSAPASLLPGTSDAVTVPVRARLEPGVYSIEWEVTSAVDGHTTRGLVPFTVGEALAPIAAPTQEASSGGVLGVVARWLASLSALTLAGSFAFVPLFLVPALRRFEAALRSDSARPEDLRLVEARVFRRLLLVLAGCLAISAVAITLAVLVEADTGTPGALTAEAIGDFISDTRRGTLWLVRAALTLVLAGAVAALATQLARPRRVLARRELWAALAAGGAALLLAQSLGSHSAGLNTPPRWRRPSTGCICWRSRCGSEGSRRLRSSSCRRSAPSAARRARGCSPPWCRASRSSPAARSP